ncbi:MAG: hypothetical protein ACLFVJ_05065 [Persicimonas sp.]
MNWERRNQLLIFAALFALSLVLSACASSASEDPECTSGADCELGEDCNVELGVCEQAVRGNNVGNNNVGNNTSPNNNSADPDAGGDDPDADGTTPDPDTGADTGPTPDADETGVCDPACGDGETCEDGQCVGLPEPTCTRKGDACDPAVVDQDTFWCAGDGEDGGECLPKCDESFTATGCALGEYCMNIGSQDQPALACIESQCSANSDCSSETCLDFDNEFGLCVASGSTPEGGSCNPSAENACAPDHYCREEPQDSGQGTCRQLCDPWASGAGCPSGQLCDLFTSREGICVPDTTTGFQPYDSCSDPGSMCDDGVICLEGSSGGVCIGYCRAGMDDCGDSPVPMQCNNYMVPGERAWGLCLATCPDYECGDGSVCDNGICRQTCTEATVTQDCCNGSTPCDWSCVNGRCE